MGNTFTKTMAAAAFAEAGEHETAKEMLDEGDLSGGTSPAVPPTPTKKPYGKTLAFGTVSLAMYITFFMNEDMVMATFTKGGINTLWPIGAAFLFSFIHSTFGSNLLSVLGLKAKK